ncbi:MAG: hypothetical protein CSYNP_03136 [Syntrophus sp. SKADARSKE-3]|nr:hypothetical protein [Syntrophus sp. SKADARSKE-3]
MENIITCDNNYCEMALKNRDGNIVANTVFSKRHTKNVKKFKWHLWVKNNKWGKVYYYIAAKIRINGKPKTFYLHHLIMGKPEGTNVIDHINRNTFDNRDENLRIASRKENLLNTEYKIFGKFTIN